jgi:hypothetical protein
LWWDRKGESVRVVEEPVGSVDDRAYADSMACDEERDFANRILAERDAAIRERESLKDRVTELEAASGGGEGEPVDQKPGFYAYENCVGIVAFSKHHFGEVAGCEAVPLYRSPPQPRGWLTGEEREAIALAAAEAPESDFVTNEEGRRLRAVLTALLARSTPPEVVRVPLWKSKNSQHQPFMEELMARRDAEWIAALAAAGVAVKEVGDE